MNHVLHCGGISRIGAFFAPLSWCVGSLTLAVPMPAATFRPALPPGVTAPAEPTLAHVLDVFAGLAPLSPPFELTSLEWRHGVGDPAEGKHPSLDQKPPLGEVVRPPHRVLLPDTPLWYETTISASEPAILRVSGDDGVQVFVDGQRVRSMANQLFPLPAGAHQALTVRVVNNAMGGGLRFVERAPSARYAAWRIDTEFRERVGHVVRKLARLAITDNAARVEATRAVLAAVRDPSAATIAAAEESLARWPVFRVAPFLQEPVHGGMTIVWESDTVDAATMEWSVGPVAPTSMTAWPHTREIAGNDGVFEARLDDLPPAQTVFYRIRQRESVSDTFSFITATNAAAPFEFTVWADSQGGWATFGRLVEHMRANPLAFSVGAGDLVNTGSLPAPWLNFFAAIHPLASSRPFFLVPGNHDYDGYYDDFEPVLYHRYARNRRLGSGRNHYFAWTWGNARFVALDPNENFPVALPPGGEQHRWLMAEVQSDAWRRAEWRFVFLHQPCYSQGWSGYQGDRRIRELLDEVAMRFGIDFVVTGHAHNYERVTKSHAGGRTHHVIVGGAGGRIEPEGGPAAPIMDRIIKTHHYGRFRVAGSRVDFEMIDLAGLKRDSFSVTK